MPKPAYGLTLVIAKRKAHPTRSRGISMSIGDILAKNLPELHFSKGLWTEFGLEVNVEQLGRRIGLLKRCFTGSALGVFFFARNPCESELEVCFWCFFTTNPGDKHFWRYCIF